MLSLNIEQPLFFLLLFPLLIYIHKKIKDNKKSQSFIDIRFISYISKRNLKQKHQYQLLINTIVCFCIIFSLARPTIEIENTDQLEPTKNVIFIVPRTMTLQSTDVYPDRLSQVKNILIKIINLPFTKETCLITYLTDFENIYPCSSSRKSNIQFVNYLSENILENKKANISTALNEAELINQDSSSISYRTVIFIDQTDPEQLEIIYNNYIKKNKPLTIIQVGKSSGSIVPLSNGKLMKGEDGKVIVSKIDTDAIKKLSADLHAIYLDADSAIDSPTKIFGNENSIIQYKKLDLGIYFLIPCILMALSFRKNYIFLLLFVITQANNSYASNEDPYSLYKDKKYKEASEKFQDHIWKGNSLYKQQKYQEAINEYKNENSYTSHFNAGNCYAFLNNFEKAIAEYKLALNINPAGSEAIHNKKILEIWINKHKSESQSVYEKFESDKKDDVTRYMESIKPNEINIIEKRLNQKAGDN